MFTIHTYLGAVTDAINSFSAHAVCCPFICPCRLSGSIREWSKQFIDIKDTAVEIGILAVGSDGIVVTPSVGTVVKFEWHARSSVSIMAAAARAPSPWPQEYL